MCDFCDVGHVLLCGGGSLELFLFFTFPLNTKITRIRGRTRSKIRHTKNAKSRYVKVGCQYLVGRQLSRNRSTVIRLS